MLKDRRRGPAGTDDELTPESTVADRLTHWIVTCRADTALARTNGARPCKTEDTLDAYARVIDKVLIPALAGRAAG